jgi:drug/metabolite transporter (DMT)-like permease
MSASRPWLIAAFLTVAIVWGSTYLAIAIALESFPPFLMAGIRFAIAGVVLYAIARLRGEARPDLRGWREAAIVGVLLCTLGNGFVVLAEQSVATGLCAVVIATMPLWGAMVNAALGKAPSRREWFALALGLAGIVVLNLGSDLASSSTVGLVAILVAPVAWAIGSVRSQRVPSERSTVMTLGMQMMVGGVAALAVSVGAQESWPRTVELDAVLALGYLVVFGSIAGYTAYGYLLRHTSMAVATSYAYVNPLVALALGAAFAGESIGIGAVVATAIVLAAVAVLRGVPRAAPPRVRAGDPATSSS